MRWTAAWVGVALFGAGAVLGAALGGPRPAAAEPADGWYARLAVGVASEDETERRAAVGALAALGVSEMGKWLPALAAVPKERVQRGLAQLVAALPRREAQDFRTAVHAHLPDALAGVRRVLARRQREADAEARLEPLIREAACGEDRAERELAAVTRSLGRDAVPALVAALQHAELDGELDHEELAEALSDVATVDDLPALVPLIQQGAPEALDALRRLNDPAVVEALVQGVETGRMSEQMLAALERFDDRPEVRAAVLRWFQRPHVEDFLDVELVGEWLGTRRVEGTVEAIRTVLRGDPMSWNRMALGVTLVRLGERQGFEELVHGLGELAADADEGARDGFARKTWAKVVAEFVRAGAPADGSDGRPSEEDFLARAQELRTWWQEAGARLRYDPASERWAAAPPR
jgi:hypothetical protein